MDLRDLIAVAWKRRWVVLGFLAITVAASAPAILPRPTQYESTAVVRAHPRRTQGQGLVASDSLTALLATYAETAKSSVNLSRAQKLARPELGAHIDTSTEGGPASCGSPRADWTGRVRRRRGGDRARVPGVDRRNKLMIATLVDPASPELAPFQPRPPLLFGVAGVLGLFGGIPARARARAVPPPHRDRRRRRAAHGRARARAAPTVSARSRAVSAALIWDQKGTEGPEGELPRVADQPRVPDGRDERA